MYLLSKTQDTRKKLSEMENKRKNSGEEAERLRNALQEAQVSALFIHCVFVIMRLNKLVFNLFVLVFLSRVFVNSCLISLNVPHVPLGNAGFCPQCLELEV